MSIQRRTIIAAVASVLIIMLLVVTVLLPKLHEISKTQASLDTAIQQEQSLRNSLALLDEVRKNAPATMAKLATIAAYLPSSPDLPGFIRLVQGASSDSGVDLRSIAPSQPVSVSGSSGIQTIGVTISVIGGFRRIEDFLTRVEGLARAVEVSAIALAPQLDPLSGLTVEAGTLTLQTFVVQPNAILGGSVPGAPPAGGGGVPSPSASASASASPSAGASQ